VRRVPSGCHLRAAHPPQRSVESPGAMSSASQIQARGLRARPALLRPARRASSLGRSLRLTKKQGVSPFLKRQEFSWLQATVFSLPHGAGAALSHGARARGAGGLRAPPPAGPRSVARGEEVRPDIYRSASTYNYAGRIPWYRTCEYGTVHGVWKRASDPRRTVCA
jgi:hypothetical protein